MDKNVPYKPTIAELEKMMDTHTLLPNGKVVPKSEIANQDFKPKIYTIKEILQLSGSPKPCEFTRKFRVLLANQDRTVVVQDAYGACNLIDQQHTENERLKEALELYGGHSQTCGKLPLNAKCICGFEQALSGKDT